MPACAPPEAFQPKLARSPIARAGINEFLIRSITTHLAFHESEEAGNMAFERETSKGVCHMDTLLEKLNYYQANRGTYPTFDSYYPIILDVF